MAPRKKPPYKRQRHFLKEWREYNELSQDDVAEIAAMSRENYGRIERGIVPYNQDLMERLAKKYGLTIYHLTDINPYIEDKPLRAFDLLRNASSDDIDRALAVISALVKKH